MIFEAKLLNAGFETESELRKNGRHVLTTHVLSLVPIVLIL